MQGEYKVQSASSTLNVVSEVFLLPDHKQVQQLNQNLKTRLKERNIMWGKGDF